MLRGEEGVEHNEDSKASLASPTLKISQMLGGNSCYPTFQSQGKGSWTSARDPFAEDMQTQANLIL